MHGRHEKTLFHRIRDCRIWDILLIVAILTMPLWFPT